MDTIDGGPPLRGHGHFILELCLAIFCFEVPWDIAQHVYCLLITHGIMINMLTLTNKLA